MPRRPDSNLDEVLGAARVQVEQTTTERAPERPTTAEANGNASRKASTRRSETPKEASSSRLDDVAARLRQPREERYGYLVQPGERQEVLRNVNFRAPNSLHQALRQAAMDAGVSLQELITLFCEEGLERLARLRDDAGAG